MTEFAYTGLINQVYSQNEESVYLLDIEGRIKEFCNNCPDLLGVPGDALIGEKWSELAGKDVVNKLISAFQSLHSGQRFSIFRFTSTANGETRHYRVRCSTLTGPGDEANGYLLQVSDETSGRSIAEKYDNQFEMHKLITRIATEFVNIPLEKLENATNSALSEIGRFTGADRVYVCSYNLVKKHIKNLYEWCAVGYEREIDRQKRTPFEELQNFADAHTKGKNLYIPDTGKLPDGHTKAILEMFDTKSIITIPMTYHGECMGFIGLDSVQKHRSWDSNEIQVLKLFADLLANTENSRRNDQRLRQSENRHTALLNALPDIIFRVTREGDFLDIYASDPLDLLLPRDQIIGKNIRDLLPADTTKLYFDHIERVIETGKRSVFEYPLMVNGRSGHYEARVVNSDDGEILFVVRNVTDLVESHERTEQITKNIPGAIYTFRFKPDGSMEIPYISQGIEEIAGKSVADVQMDVSNLFGVIHPEDISEITHSIRDSAQRLTKWHSIFRVKNAAGEWIWIQADSTPRKAGDGSIVWYGYMRDITKDKETAASLAYERDMMNTLMETIPDRIYFKNLESKFIRMNKTQLKRFGCKTHDDIVGKSDHDYFVPEHYEKAFNDEQKIIRTGKPIIGIEEKEVWPDGKITWASTTKMPLYNQKREIIGTYGLSRDITYKKKADQVLREREAYLSAVIENQNGHIWLKDNEGRFILVNRRFARACGFDSPELMTGKTDMDISDPRRAKKYTSEDTKVIQTGNMIVTQEKMGSGSSETWFETYKSPVKDEQGAILGITGYAIDITDRKKKVEQVRKLNTQLNALNTQKDKLFTILAHDLRNPFAGSIGMLEMIIEDRTSITDDELNEYIKLLYDNTLSSYKLLENLLEWSRTQRNKMSHAPENLHLKDILEQTFAVVRNNAQKKTISLLHEIPDELTVYADKDMLHAILRNLITNGIKFTNPGGRISINARKTGKAIEISVADNGIGIQSSVIDKLFRLDYEASTKGTSGEKGTGLGLQICKEFVELHGGVINVQSKPGEGSTFNFTLPLKR